MPLNTRVAGVELHGGSWVYSRATVSTSRMVLSKQKMRNQIKRTLNRLVYFCACWLRRSKMTTKRCRAVELSPKVNALIADALARQPTDVDATRHKHVLTNHALDPDLRRWTYVKDTRSGRVINLQCGQDGRYHRSNASCGRSIASKCISISISSKLRNQG